MSDPDRQDPEHIGDGVYVAHDGFHVWIRANDGNWGKPGPADIALQREVLVSLMEYAKRVGLL